MTEMTGRLFAVGVGVASVLALALGAIVPACYTVPEPICGFACGANGACPDDYTCNAADQRCHLNGAPMTSCSVVDAGIGLEFVELLDGPDSHLPDAMTDAMTDARMIDAAVDAETIDAATDAQVDAMADATMPDAMADAAMADASIDAPTDAAPDAMVDAAPMIDAGVDSAPADAPPDAPDDGAAGKSD